MSTAKPKKRFGCVTVLLIILIVIVVLVGAAVVLFMVNQNASKAGREMIESPVDPKASAMVEQLLAESGIEGIRVAVVPLPGGKPVGSLPEPPDEEELADEQPPANAGLLSTDERRGNAAILVINTATAFRSGGASGGVRNQALNTIKRLAELNRSNDLNLQHIGLEYQDGGHALAAIRVPMEAVDKLANGEIDDAEFLAQVDIELKDVAYLRTLVEEQLCVGLLEGSCEQ